MWYPNYRGTIVALWHLEDHLAPRPRIRRPLILDGAAALLESGLYTDLTVDALARSLRMSKSTLYKHFSSKDEVVVSLLEERCTATERDVESAQDKTPRAALAYLVELCARHAERLPRAALVDEDRLPPACRRRVDATRECLAQALLEVLRRGREQGELGVVDPALATEAIMASSWAACCAAARGDLPVDRGQAVRSVLPLFRL